METFKVSQFSCFSLQVRKPKPTRLNDLTWPWSPSLAKLGLGPRFSDLQGSLCHPLLIRSSEFTEIIALSFSLLPLYIVCVCACTHLVAQWCPTLCDLMDWSLPGSSVHGILQARVLEWVTVPSSRRSSPLRDRTQVSYVSCIQVDSLPSEPFGKPPFIL